MVKREKSQKKIWTPPVPLSSIHYNMCLYNFELMTGSWYLHQNSPWDYSYQISNRGNKNWQFYNVFFYGLLFGGNPVVVCLSYLDENINLIYVSWSWILTFPLRFPSSLNIDSVNCWGLSRVWTCILCPMNWGCLSVSLYVILWLYWRYTVNCTLRTK